MQELAVELTGGGDAAAIGRLRTKFPTGAVAVLEVGCPTWAQLGRGWANLSTLVLARELP